jgi:hypothetical protein
MKKFLLSLLFLSIGMLSFGQSATRIWQTTGLTFPHGFTPFEADKSIFFNAYHASKGFQLFQLKGDRLIQVSSFKQKLEKKEDPENIQGAQTSHYAWFNNQLYFFAAGKGVKSGIYSFSFGKPRLVYACDAMSNGFLRGKTLATQVRLIDGDSSAFHHIIIDSYLKVRRYKLDQINMCSDLVISNGKNYGVLNGVLGEVVVSDQRVDFYSVQFDNPNFGNCASLTSLKDGLAFMVYANGAPHIGTINHSGDIRTYGYPDRVFGKKIHCEPYNDETAAKAYFVIQNQQVSTLMEMKIGKEPREVKDLPELSDITSSTLLKKQTVLSIASAYEANIYQINGTELVEQEIRYIDHPNMVTQLNGTLVYLARENNKEFIYASDPLLPPKVETSSFTIFEFWPSGRVVGMVNAKSQNRKGRLRYKIVSGNDGDVFRVDPSSGVLTINNARKLKKNKKPSYSVRVEVSEKHKGSSIATVNITVNEGRPFSHNNLRETLMFFPDFSRVNTLTTTKLPDGETVLVYDLNFNMVDLLFVENSAIILPAYPPGLYILNVRNKENLYQKIELH